MMKRLIGIFLIFVSIFGCFYLGGKILFFNSILQIKEAIKSGWIFKDIALGLFKIFIATPTIEISAITIFLLGRYLTTN